MNVLAENTSVSGTRVLCATVAVLRLLKRKCAVSAWAISNWWYRLCISGISRVLPNKIGYLLGVSSKKLETIIYYERYVVIQPGIRVDKGQNMGDLLTEEEYLDILETLPKDNQYLPDEDPNKFIAKMGAEAVHDLLGSIDLDHSVSHLRNAAATETSQQRKADALKRLSVVEAFRDANTRIVNRPEWMVMQYIPVIPPELRPLVPLDGGRFASSDLNDLYRRVIIRNNRLKRLAGNQST